MICKMPYFDQTWPDLSSNFKLEPLMSNWVLFDLSWREEHNGEKIVALDLIGQKLVKKNVSTKNWCFASVNFDLWSLNRWHEVKLETTSQIGRFIAHLLFFPLVAIYHSLGSRAAQLEPCLFDRKVRKFCNDDVIWAWIPDPLFWTFWPPCRFFWKFQTKKYKNIN